MTFDEKTIVNVAATFSENTSCLPLISLTAGRRKPRCCIATSARPTSRRAAAVRRYLAEFLSDPRVVEIPRIAWLPLLYGLILPLRSAKSAAKYATIWTPDGSPLKLWTDKQAKLLQGWLGEHGHRVKVRYAMRYGSPSIASQLDALKAAGATRILILPAYPQYSGTTTASLVDAVASWSAGVRYLPELRFVNHYHDDRGYVQALVRRIERYWREHGRGDHLVMSFHGVPERTPASGRPLPLPMPQDRAAAGGAAAAGKRPIHGHLPIALRQGEMAAALHRTDPARRWPGAWRGSMSSVPVSPRTAWKPWKKSARRAARPS